MSPETLNTVMILLMALLVITAVASVMIRSLLKAAIALALTSVVLTVIMYVLGSPLAAVFELSVCAGLVTAIFISAISMTSIHDDEEVKQIRRRRIKRFIYLPVILVLLAVGLILAWPSLQLNISSIASGTATVQNQLWDVRKLDIIGQIIIIVAGVFGISVLFIEREKK